MSGVTTPILSRNAVVQVAGTAIGFLTDFTMDVKAEIVKEYICNNSGTISGNTASAAPAYTASGNQSYTFKASALFVPNLYTTLLNDVLNGTPVTVIWGPQGAVSGSTDVKVTLSNCYLTAYSVKNGQKGTIAQDISGEAQSVTLGNF